MTRGGATTSARAAKTVALTTALRPPRLEICGEPPAQNIRVSRLTTLPRPEPGRARQSIRPNSVGPEICNGPRPCPIHQELLQLKLQKTNDP